ncbi:hypothetical protein AB3R30_17390 [Leptolyngbyaceae cyanobacterium UHCC 1019]
MFQDASTNPILPNSPDVVTEAKSEEATETGGFSSNSYADRLMDDLFQDVEQLLHGESRQTDPSTLTRSQPIDLPSEPRFEPESAPSSEMGSPPSLSALAEDPSASSALATLLKSLVVNQPDEQISKVPEMPSTMATSDAAVAPQNRVYDRLLLAVGCVSIVVSLALWLFYQESRRPQVVASVPAAEVAANPVSSAQNQFSDYAQKALQSIDRRSQQTMPAPTATTTAGVTIPGMPTVAVPKALTPGAIPPSRVATGLERVYVPVYQFPSNFKPPNSVTPLPTNAAPSAVPQYGAPARKPTAAAPSPITPGAPRRLAGVLELGDRSVALFEINGVTQRYGIGESIGSSGWSLVEVSKEQAMIRRNGEVRSVFVGQSF